MPRPTRTQLIPRNPHNPRSHGAIGSLGDKLLVSICAWLAFAGVVAAVAITACSIFPATASSVDHTVPPAGGRPQRQARLAGLTQSGGDLKRAVRLTRRSQSRSLGQLRSWTDEGLTIPAQATYRVLATPGPV
jgi:hypothetical protein